MGTGWLVTLLWRRQMGESGPEWYRGLVGCTVLKFLAFSPATAAKCNYCCRDPLCSAPHKNIISHFSLGATAAWSAVHCAPTACTHSSLSPRPTYLLGHHHLGSQALVPPGMGRHADLESLSPSLLCPVNHLSTGVLGSPGALTRSRRPEQLQPGSNVLQPRLCCPPTLLAQSEVS